MLANKLCDNNAQVAELVDALALGASRSNPVRVRVSPWVPFRLYTSEITSNPLGLPVRPNPVIFLA